jgi:hypothetical protein
MGPANYNAIVNATGQALVIPAGANLPCGADYGPTFRYSFQEALPTIHELVVVVGHKGLTFNIRLPGRQRVRLKASGPYRREFFL